MTNDDDLRTAVTKLADKWNNEAGALDPEAEIRALLAAHPAPETVAEMLAREAADAETMPVAEGPYVRNRPTPVPDTRREASRTEARIEAEAVKAHLLKEDVTDD